MIDNAERDRAPSPLEVFGDELARSCLYVRRRWQHFHQYFAPLQQGPTVGLGHLVSQAVASAFKNKKALPKEGSLVVLRDIAGAGFEPATFGL